MEARRAVQKPPRHILDFSTMSTQRLSPWAYTFADWASHESCHFMMKEFPKPVYRGMADVTLAVVEGAECWRIADQLERFTSSLTAQ